VVVTPAPEMYQLLGACGLSDVVDAALARLALDGDEIVTRDGHRSSVDPQDSALFIGLVGFEGTTSMSQVSGLGGEVVQRDTNRPGTRTPGVEGIPHLPVSDGFQQFQIGAAGVQKPEDSTSTVRTGSGGGRAGPYVVRFSVPSRQAAKSKGAADRVL
jgi:hypothetical protein